MAAHDPRDSREIPGLPFQGDQAFMLPPIRRARIPEREKRTYRACLHCRQRKSRCDFLLVMDKTGEHQSSSHPSAWIMILIFENPMTTRS
ncbi:hypothetical protein E4T43_06888 [Aureobasidium subglaciale]|nr:hypothetical protein E4T43_06888 [Aureobasidium subglaciale]